MGPGPILAALTRGPWPALLSVSAASWIVLLGASGGFVVPSICGAPASLWSGQGWRDIAAAMQFNPPAVLAVSWLLMLSAMMPPLLARPLRHVWIRSLARRRLRAVALFVAAYAAMWLLAGIALTIAAMALRIGTGGSRLSALVIAIGIALLWHAAPLKQICLNRCHRLPRLSPFGWAADRDCLRYGLVAGLWCVGACWAFMLVPLVVEEGHVLAMAAISTIILVDRLAPGRPARWRFPVPPLRRSFPL